ncbi:MAG: energy-coupled thiamine transporter ThiT [Lachnospiraceae bacterium]|nr:energy-coupled thiamine transporter ThiT [Lachnospiraceae bacterium]
MLNNPFFFLQDDEFVLTTAGIAVTIIMILILLATSILIGARLSKKTPERKTSALARNTLQLVFSSAAMALGIITSEVIPTLSLPMGGSITLFSMLFITLIGYWYGLGAGLTAALAYGLLQFVLDPKFLSFGQLLLDYILAFGALGLSGIFSNKKHGLILGYLTGVIGRYIFACIAGVVIWGIYAPEGMSPVVYSLTYQATYILPETILTLIILALPPVKKALDAIKRMAVV